MSHQRLISVINLLQASDEAHSMEGGGGGVSTLVLKPKVDVTTSLKQRYQWPHKIAVMFFKKNFKNAKVKQKILGNPCKFPSWATF